MSTWSLTLKVHDSGLIQVTGFTEDIPPGEIEVSGSDDGNRVTLEARQRDAHGRFVASASHVRDRAGEALHDAEHVAEVVEAAGGEAAISVTVAGEVPGA